MQEIPTNMLVVAAALQRTDGLWLMHRRPLAKHHGGLWEFPGGKVERGETPANALVRELNEELGIGAAADALAPAGFAVGDGPEPNTALVILLYRCPVWTGHARAIEGEAIGWFTPKECLALELAPLDSQLAALLFASKAC